jgi:hypothetical protein
VPSHTNLIKGPSVPSASLTDTLLLSLWCAEVRGLGSEHSFNLLQF